MNNALKMAIFVCAASFMSWIALSVMHGYWCALSYALLGKTETELVASRCEAGARLLLTRLLAKEYRFEIAMAACDANMPETFVLAAVGVDGELIDCTVNATTSLLHHCAMVGCFGCCVALIENEICSFDIVDAEGRKPVDVASTTEIAAYLLSFDFG